MVAPSGTIATLRPDLGSVEEFDLEMQARGFVASRLFPVLDVMLKGDTFGKIPIEQLLKNPETRRAPGALYNRTHSKFETDTYACEENGIEGLADDSQAKKYRHFFDLEQFEAKRAYEIVLQALEQRVASLLYNTSYYTGSDRTLAITNEWDDSANAVPIDDVEAGVQHVWQNTGLWPNTLLLNLRQFRRVRNCTQILDRLKYSGHTDPKRISAAVLSEVFELDVIVAGATKKTSAEGISTLTFGSTWSDEHAMVCRRATTNDIIEPCIGRIFNWSEDGSQPGGTIETYRDEPRRGEVVRVRMDTDEKIILADTAFLFSNVLTL